jgi:hypothetical protein
MTRRSPSTGRTLRALAVSCLCLGLGGTASADDPWEFWPEGQLYVGLNPRTRLFLNGAYAQGKESSNKTLDAAAYIDISFLPIGPRRRSSFKTEDWQRGRYFWARVGYDHVFKAEDGTPSPGEDRGILSLWAKVPLPGNVWLENRARADLRWISDEYSTRYRFRMEFTREWIVAGHAVVPYFNVEWFYDTRYDGWARTLYQAGPEVTLNKKYRFEVFLARQTDHLPSASSLNAFGIVLKGYF